MRHDKHRRLAKKTGKRKIVVIIRERNGNSVPAVFESCQNSRRKIVEANGDIWMVGLIAPRRLRARGDSAASLIRRK